MNHKRTGSSELKLITALGVAFAVATLCGPLVSHPGLHALVAACLLNLVLWTQFPRWSVVPLVVLVAIDCAAVWVILFSKFDIVEDWFSIMCIIDSILLIGRRGGESATSLSGQHHGKRV